jgi:predicted Zn-dependent peptidase
MRLRWALLLLLLTGAARGTDLMLPEFERVELENGTVLLLNEKHDVPLIGLTAMIRGGAATDPQDKAGLAALFAAVMQKGAGERDAQAFAEAFSSVGGRLDATVGAESISVSADFLARDVELMLELVSDMLVRPRIDADEVARERERTIGLIKAAKGSSPQALLPAYADAFLFAGHPYGSPVGGSEESLALITHEDLVAYHRDRVGGDRLVIAVSGDFDGTAMRERLAALFGDWRAAAEPLEETTAPGRAAGGRVLLIDKPGATQTYFWIGNVGIAVDYVRRAEADLANTVFGGRFTSLLMTELRVKTGLTYGARSVLDRRSQPGSVTIRSFTETATTVEAVDRALAVLAEFRDDGLDDDAIDSARHYIMGQFPPRLETASSLAEIMAFLEFHGLDSRYIDNYGAALAVASPKNVAAAIEDIYPSPDELVFVMIGDAAQIRDDVGRYGEITEMSISEPRFAPHLPK